jgi:AcrR family transcriptional regulator
MSAIATRERLVIEAMRLFSEQGYGQTSVAQIERAAGLAAGSGALYHHFKSKEELVEAGIDRQLDRRNAMQGMRALFAGLGDLPSELTMLGRYILTVLDDETQLLQLTSTVPSDMRRRLDDAYAALFEGLTGELADWVKGWAPQVGKREAARVGAFGVNALLGKRALTTVFRAHALDIPDDQYLTEWTAMLVNRIQTLQQGM